MSTTYPPSAAAESSHGSGFRHLVAIGGLLAVGLPGSDGSNEAVAPWGLMANPLGGTWLGAILLCGVAATWQPPTARLHAWLRSLFGVGLALVATYALSQWMAAGRFDAPPSVLALWDAPFLVHGLFAALVVGALAGWLWLLTASERAPDGGRRMWTITVVWLALLSLAPMSFDLDGATLAAVVGSVSTGPVSDRVASACFCSGLALAATLPLVRLKKGSPLNPLRQVGAVWTLVLLAPLTALALGSSYPDRWFDALESLKLSLTFSGAVLLAVSSAPWWSAGHADAPARLEGPTEAERTTARDAKPG